MQSDPLHRAQGNDRPASDGADGRALDDDTAFALLGNGRRRTVIRRLASASGQVRLSDLVDAVAADETTGSTPSTPSTTVGADAGAPVDRRVSVALQQVHLPKLANAGVVRYDRRKNVVAPTPALDALAARLARSTDDGEVVTDRTAPIGSLLGRVSAALVAAVLTTLALSGEVVAALSTAVPALLVAGVVALAVFGTLTLIGADRPGAD